MKIGDSVFIKDIKVPAEVKVLNDPELIVFIVKAPKVEVPVEEAPAAAEEPELIRKKKEEEAEEGAEPAKEAAKEAAKPAAAEKKEEKK
jgi:hypothetical protein